MGRLAEILNPSVPLAPSLWHILNDGVDKFPNEPAITACHQIPTHRANLLQEGRQSRSDQPFLSWTYRELRYAVLLVAKRLHEAGARRGSTIMMFTNNGIESVLLFWTAAALQLTLVPLEPALLEPSRRDMLDFFVQKTKPETFVVLDLAKAEQLDQVLQSSKMTVNAKFVLSEQGAKDWHSFASITATESEADLISFGLAQDSAVEQAGSRIAAVLFTSGTSAGKPKGCPLSARNFLNFAAVDCGYERMPTSWVLQNINRGGVWNATMVAMPTYGRHCIVPSAVFDAGATLDAVERCRGEMIRAMGAHIHLLTIDPSFPRRDMSSVIRILIGGDILTVDALAKAQRHFPNACITTSHGMTEGAGVIGLQRTDVSKPMPTLYGICSPGRPVAGAKVRVCDTDGRVLLRGEQGELHIGGQSIISGYLDGLESKAFYIDKFGNWLKTGDKAVMDDDDYIYIVGRMKDIIKQSGWSLSPAVIESVINKHDLIRATVVGSPHNVKGETPVAVCQGPKTVATRSTAEWKEQVQEWVRSSLPPEYALEDVVFLSELGWDEFPMNATGKIEKVKVKEAVLKLRDQPSKGVNGLNGHAQR